MQHLELIGISGKAGTGKDFVGREIFGPLGFRRFALANHMKNEGVGAGFTYEEMHVTKPPEARAWLQRRGTQDGWQQSGDRFYWCRIADAWMRTIAEDYGVTKFYCPDIRFPHELQWVQNAGGKVIRLEHGDRPYPLAGTPAAEHLSEIALDGDWQFDCVIENRLGTSKDDIRRVLRMTGVLPSRVDAKVGAWLGAVLPESVDPR